MDIETIREYALSLPYTSEDMPFGEDALVIRVMGRIFVCFMLPRPDIVTLKCNPEYAQQLRQRFESVEGAWHWNKKYWNQIRLNGELPSSLLLSLIRHSYREAAAKLPASVRKECREIESVEP